MMNSNKNKEYFSRKELRHFKKLLLEKRKEALQTLGVLDDSISNLKEVDDADYSSIAHHMGDVGSDVEEEELNYQLKERTQKFIEEINDALERIKKGTYGMCRATGKPISKERLEAVPHTRYSIQAKQEGLAEDG
ncbi:TraR/DksA family transcriptional regulator [Halalkalibaculum sp. DA3122]|uniref:TraR/DksA family transcriptional regulator n=1 Tax=unclassified Halalkalibaculum TaxID=2964617 RepID=UPI0037545D35